MRLQIDVTKSDIRLGGIQEANSCPIARSVKRTLGLRGRKAERLSVLQEALEFESDDNEGWEPNVRIAILPAVANTFMHDFDRELPVNPFSFYANFSQAAAKSVGLTLPKA